MKTSGLLDQLLKSGQAVLQQQKTANPSGRSSGGLGDLLGGGAGGGGLSGMLSGGGGNALAAAAMGMLLGSKRSRLGGKAAKYGGLAALGMLAYKAYSSWQAQQAAAPQAAPQTVDRVPPAEVEGHSQAVLKALVAAAKADGHVDEQERQQIEAEMTRLTDDGELQRWLQAELNRPLDPADVAAAAQTPEMAAEMYLASLLATDEEQYMERAYLDELARQLKLDPALKQELEAQARAA
ncbi:tellurite resistance TerB family protein [Stutzerimonas azotifigens]|uniref:tellurite resistance TerB family protein n=1 Tax=Stutzerimonas azotifigens TaxID=291995 RepID=UPI00041DD5C8|nr:tellurite resistance TerB family protein [Stutzerimonas azotifigens]